MKINQNYRHKLSFAAGTPFSRNRNIKLQRLALVSSIVAGFLTGCNSPRVVENTNPKRPSNVQVAEGYDTVGRKWESPAPPPAPAPVVVTPAPTISVGAPAPAATASSPEVLSRNESVLLTYTGTITDIDYPDRQMTLKSSEGKVETFAVEKEVQRFKEAKVGDKVSLEYYLGYNAEVRKPTPEEERNPLVLEQVDTKAGLDASPAAQSRTKIRAVVTIEGLNRTAQTLTVKGPRGKSYTARVADPSRFEKVRIGDTILMTFTEATAISLKPAVNE
jgi:hypothetical protein